MTNATGIIDNKEMCGKWLQRAIWWLSQSKYKVVPHSRLCWRTSLQLVTLFEKEGDRQETLGGCGLTLWGVGHWEHILGVNVLLWPLPIMLCSLTTRLRGRGLSLLLWWSDSSYTDSATSEPNNHELKSLKPKSTVNLFLPYLTTYTGILSK